MSYQDNVAAAAAALTRGEDANWELARLTFENTSFRGQVAGTVGVSQWSTDVEEASGRNFGFDTATNYRDIWRQFGEPDPERVRMSWSDAYAAKRGGSVGERMVEADFNRSMKNATPEFKSAAFQRLAEDPDVVQSAISKHETRQALSDGLARHIPELTDGPTFGDFKEQILQKIPGPTGRAVLFDGLQQLEVLSRRDDVAWLTEDITTEEAEMLERDIPRYINWLTRVRDAARRSIRRMELVK